MNILVTGANGQLGNELRIVSGGTGHNFVFTDINQPEGVETAILDITDLDAVRQMVGEHHIDAIVNCAGYTNVDAAETNTELAEKLNAAASENLAIAMKEAGGVLVHISTDYVFGTEPYNTPCTEDRQGTPTGIYGLSKLHGEQKIIASGCKHFIIRTAWLYSEFGKNFCKTMLALTATKPCLSVVFDQCGTPTYALDLAKAILVILDDYAAAEAAEASKAAEAPAATPAPAPYSKFGIYNFSNEGVCSWYDFTKAIQNFDNELRTARGLEPTACDVRPCHSNEFPSPVRRPAYSVLDKTKIKTAFGIDIPYWTDSLRRCIANLSQMKTPPPNI